MGRSWLLALALAACHVAPQSPGWKRDAFIGMATANGVVGGAMAGGLTGALPCLIALSHRCPDPYETAAKVGAVIGGLAGGIYTYETTTNADTSPSRNEWIVTATPTALVGTVVVIAVVAKVWDVIGPDDTADTGPRDSIVEIWELHFPTADAAQKAINRADGDCRISNRVFSTHLASVPRFGPSDQYAGKLCVPALGESGQWKVAFRVVTKV